MDKETHNLIREFTSDIAAQAGIRVTKIVVVEGKDVGCVDTHLMNLISKGYLVSVLVYKSDLDQLLAGQPCYRLEMKLRTALSRLKCMLES